MKAERIPDAILVPKIAALKAIGRSSLDIAKQLNISRDKVVRLAATDDCKALQKEVTGSLMEGAKALGRKEVAEMMELATAGLKALLRDNNIQAIQTVFKVVGILGAEEQVDSKGTQSLTIVMPGASMESPAIEVKSEQEV